MTQRLSLLILGRPNVGKSTLFNRLLAKRVAITQDQPGVTRDWQEYIGEFQGIPIRLFDTPGLTSPPFHNFAEKTQALVSGLLPRCDAILLIIDGKAGVTPDDIYLANWLRQQSIPIIVVANKCEGATDYLAEGTRLGLGVPVPISALHGQGMRDLAEALEALPRRCPVEEPNEATDMPTIVILGRPNVGKSTFINQCLGYERLLTSPEAGTTRDAVTIAGNWHGRPFRFVDTAGLRKRSHIHTELEKMACRETFHALVFSHIVIVLLDATRGLEKQDLTIIEKVIAEGRGLIIALNKWDQVKDKKALKQSLQRCLQETFASLRGIPLFPISALKGEGFKSLWPAVFTLYDKWSIRLSTGQLNRWLQDRLAAHNPPMVEGRRIKIKYISQIKTRPPTFALFGNQLSVLPEAYKRYLANELVKSFHLQGTSLRLMCREAANPYTS